MNFLTKNKPIMKKLLNEYGFISDMQYFDMIVESFINGQRTQALDQFKVLPRINKKQMIKALAGDVWSHRLMNEQVSALIDLI